ncbi:MAG: metallophosphoesterase [Clostridia bacterium]|nr:metallophosphoesterase [Clostridia bacterium]
MRKILSFILCLSITCSVFIFPSNAQDSYTYGDVDADGKITAADALLILQVVVGKLYLDREGYYAADVTGDVCLYGYFDHTAEDALLVLKYVVGKITRFPAQDLDPNEPPVPPDFTPDGELVAGQEVDFILEIPQGRDIKILQLNDLQPTYLESGEVTRHGYRGPFGATMTQSVWPYVTEAINAANPDLIVLGGDNVEGAFDDTGAEWEELCTIMDSYQIPWMIVFGNHDRESITGTTWQKAMLEQSEYCLFASADCTGDSNYTVAVKQGDQYKYILWALDTNGTNPSLLQGNPQADLICTESGLQADQINWIKNTAYGIEYDLGKQIPSLLFMHIPPACINNAIDKYYPDYIELPFTPTEDGDFGIATELPGGGGSKDLDKIATNMGCKGMFFGHQHQVALSIDYQGIRYTWGLKSSTGSYIDRNLIGSTLITINEQTNAFTIDYLFSDLI